MPRLIFYELKKILSLPALVLLVASLCILVGAPVSRYASFTMETRVPLSEYRKLTMEYAGPLNWALADRALADWRKLPGGYTDEQAPEDIARRHVLLRLADEYASMPEAPGLPEKASWDAGARLGAATAEMKGIRLVHGYHEGWRAWFASLDGEGAWLCAALLVFGLTALFSGEASSGMASLVRTTRNGRRPQAAAKLAAAGLYALACAALCALLPLGVTSALFGMDGGELPAQLAAKLPYPFTMAGYGMLRVAMLLLGALGMAAVTALLSAILPSATAPAVMGFAVFLAPVVYQLLRLNSAAVDTVMRYMPARLFLPAEILGKLQAAMLWQAPLWQPQWLALLWAALIPLLSAAAAAAFLRTPREEPVIQD
jgi:hypothetical protein